MNEPRQKQWQEVKFIGFAKAFRILSDLLWHQIEIYFPAYSKKTVNIFGHVGQQKWQLEAGKKC